MRALHLLPVFGTGSASGSERYFAGITRELVARGIEIDVWTTRSARVRATSAFGLAWRDDFGVAETSYAGARVRRFRALTLPAPLGHAVSRLILERWRREERQYGPPPTLPLEIAAYHHRRAVERPALFDRLALAARGPHAPGLWRELGRGRRRYDVVLAGYVPFATLWYGARLARWIGAPLVVAPLLHSEDPHHHFAYVYRSLRAAAAVVAETAHTAAVLRRLAPTVPTDVIGVGVDADAFRRSTISGARFRARYGLEGKRLILCVGRKETGKRWEILVDAVETLARDEVRLVLVGDDVDRRPVRSRYAIMVGPLGPAELADAYDACDVYASMSDRESFGLTFVEAWMRAKPVIGNVACGAVAALVRPGVTGFLCASAADVARSVADLLAHPELARRIGEAGRREAVERYSWRAVGARFADLYARLAASSRRVAAASGGSSAVSAR